MIHYQTHQDKCSRWSTGYEKSKGFTLIELLVVIAIIGMLVSIVAATIFSVIDRMDTNYLIRHDGSSYFIESYTKENQGQCVYISELEKRLCGDYSIEKLNTEE